MAAGGPAAVRVRVSCVSHPPHQCARVRPPSHRDQCHHGSQSSSSSCTACSLLMSDLHAWFTSRPFIANVERPQGSCPFHGAAPAAAPLHRRRAWKASWVTSWSVLVPKNVVAPAHAAALSRPAWAARETARVGSAHVGTFVFCMHQWRQHAACGGHDCMNGMGSMRVLQKPVDSGKGKAVQHSFDGFSSSVSSGGVVVWWVRCVALCPTWYMCQGLPLVLGFFFLSPAATTAVASSSSFGSLGSFALST
jgi:hypothetical protein